MVLYKSYMPSVLIEAGFLTNKEEGAYLNSKKGQKEIANEIAKGIITYKKSLSVSNEIIQDSSNQLENINSQNNSPSESNYNGVEFRVQIAASSKKLETKPYNFKGLKNIERKKEGKLFKYYYGSTFDYDEILKLKIDALEIGYSSCYIVAFKDGKKLKLSDVLISTNK